eukprot:TRINITY_DN12155_c0_g1_i2.p1 TRINITY_DN12155_c0_g1~~TRINITY_DN12155_c0_g1_i2.p1  ORF type:complete len:330 (-),score=69.92 TRINITY_DN12155_c0_g1_i2:43-1032(-)
MSLQQPYSAMPAGPQPLLPAQGYGYGAASAPLTAAEKKKADKAKKQQDVSQRRERMRQAKRKQQETDANSFIVWMSIFLILFGTLLALTMVGNSWCYRDFTGFGVGLLTIRSSLMNVEVDFNCEKSFAAERAICNNLLAPYKGKHFLHELQGHACTNLGINVSSCNVFAMMYQASFVIFILFTLSALCNWCAAFCLYAYYFSAPHPQLRTAGSWLVAGGPLFGLIGIGVWTALIPDLEQIPASWNEVAAIAGGLGNLFLFRAVQELQFGWTWFAAVIVTGFMVMQTFLWYCWFQVSADEDEVLRQELLDQEYADSLQYEDGDGEFFKFT